MSFEDVMYNYQRKINNAQRDMDLTKARFQRDHEERVAQLDEAITSLNMTVFNDDEEDNENEKAHVSDNQSDFDEINEMLDELLGVTIPVLTEEEAHGRTKLCRIS